MARFTGAGNLTIGGNETKAYDCEFMGGGGLIVAGSNVQVSRNKFLGSGDGITVNSGNSSVLIQGNLIDPSGVGVDVLGNNDQLSISDNYIGANADTGIHVAGASNTKHVYADNMIESDVPIHIDGATIGDLVIDGNTMVPTTFGIHVDTGGASTGKISNNVIRAGTVGIFVDNASNLAVTDNFCDEPDEDGIVIDGMLDGMVAGNDIYRPGAGANNSHDGIRIVTADDLIITGNKVTPLTAGNLTRYGINIVAGNNLAVYANYLGDSSDYGTADSVDGGTGTQTSPAAGAIGGQFAY